MKVAIVCFFTCFLSAVASSAAPSAVVIFEQGTGFSPNPYTLNVSVLNNGKVVSVYEFLGTPSKKVIKTIARLSADGMASLMTKISRIDKDTIAGDENPEDPMCEDAPSQQIFVMKEAQKVLLYRWANCHTYQVPQGADHEVIKIVNGLVALSR